MSRTTVVIAVVTLALAGCASSSPDLVRRGEAQTMSTVLDATVLSVRPIKIEGSQSGGGAVAGGAIGAIAGSSVGGHRESAVVGIIGAVAGGVLGNLAERAATTEDGIEIMVQLRSGERRAIVQSKGNETFNPGDAVIIVSTGNRVRVSHAPAVQPAAPAGTKS